MKGCLESKGILDVDSVGGTKFFWVAGDGNLVCVMAIAEEAKTKQQLSQLINKAHEEGFTPLYLAALHGHADVVQYLLDNGATVDSVSNEKDTGSAGTTPLNAACEIGSSAIVNILLKSGADVTKQREDGTDCAYAAAQRNHFAVLKMILPSNPNLAKRKVTRGNTILQVTASNNHHECVRYIINHGGVSTINVVNNFDDTPLTVAVRFDGDLKMIKLLIKNGADPQLNGYQGKTPLEWAEQKNKGDIANFLKTL